MCRPVVYLDECLIANIGNMPLLVWSWPFQAIKPTTPDTCCYDNKSSQSFLFEIYSSNTSSAAQSTAYPYECEIWMCLAAYESVIFIVIYQF